MFISQHQKSLKSVAGLSVLGGGEPVTVQHEEKQPDELITVQKAKHLQVICAELSSQYEYFILQYQVYCLYAVTPLLQSFEL